MTSLTQNEEHLNNLKKLNFPLERYNLSLTEDNYLGNCLSKNGCHGNINDDALQSQQFWWLHLAYSKRYESPKFARADSAYHPPPLLAVRFVSVGGKKADLKSCQRFHDTILLCRRSACSYLFSILLVYHLIPLVVVGKTPTLLTNSFLERYMTLLIIRQNCSLSCDWLKCIMLRNMPQVKLQYSITQWYSQEILCLHILVF